MGAGTDFATVKGQRIRIRRSTGSTPKRQGQSQADFPAGNPWHSRYRGLGAPAPWTSTPGLADPPIASAG